MNSWDGAPGVGGEPGGLLCGPRGDGILARPPARKLVLDNLPVVRHSFRPDAFINHHTVTTRGLLRQGDRYLIAAAGLGATLSAMVLEP